jgi:L-amino acid N-acyltransferase YncA
VGPHSKATAVVVRPAHSSDLDAIRLIYNQGIEDRCATLETEPHDATEIAAWWSSHDNGYTVVVGVDEHGEVVAWASLNRFSHRCAHDAIADLSIYVERAWRGNGIGTLMLTDLFERARKSFHKVVLHALDHVDVIAMEKLLT